MSSIQSSNNSPTLQQLQSLLGQLKTALVQNQSTQANTTASGGAGSLLNATAATTTATVSLGGGIGSSAATTTTSPSAAISSYNTLPTIGNTSQAASSSSSASSAAAALAAQININNGYSILSTTQKIQIQNSSTYKTLQSDLQLLGSTATIGLFNATETNASGVAINNNHSNLAKTQYLNRYIASVQQGAKGGTFSTGSQQQIAAAQTLIQYFNNQSGNDTQIQQSFQLLAGNASSATAAKSIFQTASSSFFGGDPDDDFKQVEDALDKSTQAMNRAVNGLNDSDGSSSSV